MNFWFFLFSFFLNWYEYVRKVLQTRMRTSKTPTSYKNDKNIKRFFESSRLAVIVKQCFSLPSNILQDSMEGYQLISIYAELLVRVYISKLLRLHFTIFQFWLLFLSVHQAAYPGTNQNSISLKWQYFAPTHHEIHNFDIERAIKLRRRATHQKCSHAEQLLAIDLQRSMKIIACQTDCCFQTARKLSEPLRIS